MIQVAGGGGDGFMAERAWRSSRCPRQPGAARPRRCAAGRAGGRACPALPWPPAASACRGRTRRTAARLPACRTAGHCAGRAGHAGRASGPVSRSRIGWKPRTVALSPLPCSTRAVWRSRSMLDGFSASASVIRSPDRYSSMIKARFRMPVGARRLHPVSSRSTSAEVSGCGGKVWPLVLIRAFQCEFCLVLTLYSTPRRYRQQDQHSIAGVRYRIRYPEMYEH